MQAQLESLVGMMVSVMPACPLAPLHYRALQRDLLGSLRSGRKQYKLVSLTSTWVKKIPGGGLRIQVFVVTLQLPGLLLKQTFMSGLMPPLGVREL